MLFEKTTNEPFAPEFIEADLHPGAVIPERFCIEHPGQYCDLDFDDEDDEEEEDSDPSVGSIDDNTDDNTASQFFDELSLPDYRSTSSCFLEGGIPYDHRDISVFKQFSFNPTTVMPLEATSSSAATMTISATQLGKAVPLSIPKVREEPREDQGPAFHPVPGIDEATPIDLTRGISVETFLFDPVFYVKESHTGGMAPTPSEVPSAIVFEARSDLVRPLGDREASCPIKDDKIHNRQTREQMSDTKTPTLPVEQHSNKIQSLPDSSNNRDSGQENVATENPHGAKAAKITSMAAKSDTAKESPKPTKTAKVTKKLPTRPTKERYVREGGSRQRFREYQAKQWTRKYMEAKQFLERHGHCLIPHRYEENPELARWAKRQRYQYKLFYNEATGNGKKGSSMTLQRIEALDKLGFCWDAHKEIWMDRYKELQEFTKANGHSNVPSGYRKNRKLATWVKCQRRQYKLWKMGEKHHMNVERVTKLEEVGFTWVTKN